MPFVEYLIREHDIAAAQEMWGHMAKVSESLRPSGEGNLVVNGDFKEEIIPGGFSWRLQPPASQTIPARDTRTAQYGGLILYDYEVA